MQETESPSPMQWAECAPKQQSPLVHSIPQACSIASIGRTALYEAIRSGTLRAVKRGRRTLILHDDLLRWVQSLPSIESKSLNQSSNRSKANV
jgi:excisionase family DNA binding protein